MFTPESFPDSSALVVGHDHIQTHLEAAQHNHSLICRPLEQTESSALLKSTSVLVMRDESASFHFAQTDLCCLSEDWIWNCTRPETL